MRAQTYNHISFFNYVTPRWGKNSILGTLKYLTNTIIFESTDLIKTQGECLDYWIYLLQQITRQFVLDCTHIQERTYPMVHFSMQKKIIKYIGLLNEREYTQLQYRLIPLLLVISMLIKPINLNIEKKLSTIITDIYPITKKK